MGRDTADLALANLHVAGKLGTHQCHRHFLSRSDIGRAAHDLERLTASHVDTAHAQALRIRMRTRFEHESDHDETLGHAARGDALHLEPVHGEVVHQRGNVDGNLDVAAKPGDGHDHDVGSWNCSRKRRSFSRKRRMSGMPWRTIAMRSTPTPNAKPE